MTNPSLAPAIQRWTLDSGETRTVLGELARDGLCLRAHRDRGGGYKRRVRELLVKDGGAGRPPHRPQLEVDVRPLRMDSLDDLS